MTKEPASSPPTTRTCTACGLTKPLVAFLELAGAQGHSYGNICAACRGSGLGKKVEKTEPTEASGGTTRATLDNKAKIKKEQDQKEQLKQKTALDNVEKAKKDGLSLEKSTTAEQLEKTELKNRDDFLSTKAQSTTSQQKTGSAIDGKKLSTQSFYLNKAATEKSQFLNTTQTTTAAETLQSSNQEATAKAATENVSLVATDTQTATVGRSDESVFGSFRRLLGESAAINRTLQQYGKKTETSVKPPPRFLGEPTKTTTPEKAKPSQNSEKNLASEFINNNFKRR